MEEELQETRYEKNENFQMKKKLEEKQETISKLYLDLDTIRQKHGLEIQKV